MNDAAQLALAKSVRGVLEAQPPGPRWSAGNRMFGTPDAAVYRAMLGHLKPSRVIEAGSGYSTAVVLDEAEANADLIGLEVTCIEPYPARLNSLLRPGDKVKVLAQPVQDVALETFAELTAGDILFIDSSHVVKAGSDVAWLLLRVLPNLAPGVAVHIHDVFWPFTYHTDWLTEHRDWNEAYFLHAFLSGNSQWEILLFTSWLWREHAEMVPPNLRGKEPGSVWLQKVR